MLNCNYPNCKKHKTCNLKEPTTKKHQLLTQEINYYLKKLHTQKRRILEYERIFEDITKYHTYSIPVNVYGHIMYAPKSNIFGVFIRRPEHVNKGWNLNQLERVKDDLLKIIRELRFVELHIDEYDLDNIMDIIKEIET